MEPDINATTSLYGDQESGMVYFGSLEARSRTVRASVRIRVMIRVKV